MGLALQLRAVLNQAVSTSKNEFISAAACLVFQAAEK